MVQRQPFGQSPLVTSFGRQIPAERPSSPAYRFPRATRASSAGARPLSPGPIYSTEGGLGTQHDSSKYSEPMWGFGSNPRSKPTAWDSLGPGPAEYSSEVSMGVQTLSKRETSPMYGFGTGSRDARRKLFVSAEHAKDQHGLGSPGPTTAIKLTSSGRQVLSNRPSSPQCGMHGGKNRFNYPEVQRAGRQPGPASYVMQSGVGTQADSRKSSAPRATFGSSTRAPVTTGAGLLSPGPAKYSGETSAFGTSHASSRRRASPGWGFGSQARWGTGPEMRPKSAKPLRPSPGPGAYL